MVVRRVGILSCAKVAGVLYALFGVIMGGIFALASFFGAALGARSESMHWFGALFGVGAIVIFPILYGVMGFVGGLITSGIYNWLAGMVGGIELELQ